MRFKAVLLPLFLTLALLSAARAFEHPGLPLTVADLDDLKAKITAGTEPWASVYAGMASYVNSNYVMAGPFEYVSRTPDVNNGAWKADMGAIYDLARMWYFTGNSAYAQKGRDVLIAWATTHTAFGGAEGFMDMGDWSYRLFNGADILRGTWPGWTQADTDICKNYFNNVFWWAAAVPDPLRSANQGAMQLPIGMGVAVFNDDTNKFNQVLQAFRADAAGGLADTLPNGEMGDTGRDQGHAYGQLQHLSWIAEVFWKQGVDVYGELDNRLLHVGEFFARHNLGVPTTYIPFGTTYDLYPTVGGGGYFNGVDMMNTLHAAYVTRMGLDAPYIKQYRDRMGEGADSMVMRKTADASMATPPAPFVLPTTQSATTGLTGVDIGGATPAGSSSYSAGTWMVTGAGPTITYGTADTCRFVYMPLTGDCTILARVASSPSSRAGVMIRESLAANASMMACYMDGTQAWAALRGFTASSHNGGVQIHDFVSVPYWVKLERIGKRITAFHSPDGASWTEIQIGDYNAMSETVYVGLCQASYTSGTLNTATFTDVRITRADGGEAPKIPAAPLAIYGSPGFRQVPLRWVDAFGATNYNIKRATSSGGVYTTLASVAEPCYTDLTPVTGATNYYVISASNAAGESTNSVEEAVVVPLPWSNVAYGGTATASAQATGQTAAKAFDGTSSSKWYNNGAGGTGWLQYNLGTGNSRIVSGYDLTSANDVAARDPVSWQFQGSNNGSTWTTLDTQSGQSFAARYFTQRYLFSNSTAYQYYRLNITANGGDAGLQLSELTLLSPTLAVPPMPTNLVATVVSSSQIDLNWSTATNADCYFVKRSTTDGGPYTTVGIPLGRRFSDNALVAGTTYYYILTAVNAGGESTSSTQVTAATPAAVLPDAPTNLAATVIGVSRIGLTWDAAPGVYTYAVKRATVSGGPYTFLGNITGTSFNDAGLNSSTTYYYVIASVNHVGEGANSLEVSAQPSFAPARLHAYLRFDESEGVTAADSSGNGWDGTLINTPTWVAGYNGNAVNLPNTGSQYVTLPEGVVSGIYDFSIALRVKQTAVSSWARAFDFGTGTTAYMFLAPRNGQNNLLRFAITTGGGAGEQKIDGTTALPTGVWKHVVVTLSGSVGILYVDGVPVGTNSSMTLTPNSLGNTAQNFLGKAQFNDPYLNGLLDEFRIYKGTLTPTQIATVMNAFPAPTGFAVAVAGAQVNLSWNWVSNNAVAVTNYNVKRSLFNGGPYTTIATVSTTNFTDSGLSGGIPYYYVVSAFDSTLAVESANSAQVSATVTIGSTNNPVWDGGDASSRLWSASTNWVGEVSPANNTLVSSLTFVGANNTGTSATPLTNDLTNVTFTNLNFWMGASSFVIAGNPLINAGNINNYASTTQTFNAGLVMSASPNVHLINVAAGPLVLGGSITAPSSTAVVAKTGPGVLYFTSPLTNTLCNGGSLNSGADYAAAFNVDAGPVVFNGGASSLYNITGEIAIGRQGDTGNTNAALTVSSGKVAVSGVTSLARANGTGSVSSDLVLSNAAAWTTANFTSGYNNNDATRKPRGTLNLNGTSAFTATANASAHYLAESAGSFITADLNGSATFTINGGTSARLMLGNSGRGLLRNNSSTATVTLNQLHFGEASGGAGAFYNRGIFRLNSAASTDHFAIGVYSGGATPANNGYGYYLHDSATLLGLKEIGVGALSGGDGVLEVKSGTVNVTNWITLGRSQATTASAEQRSLLLVRGGTVNGPNTANQHQLNWSPSGIAQHAVIDIGAGGKLGSLGVNHNVYLSCTTFTTGNNSNNVGILTVSGGGVVEVNNIAGGQTNPVTVVNLNNATLKPLANTSAYLGANLDGVYVHAGGVTFDTGAFSITNTAALLAPTGNGIASLPLTGNGVGYIGRPMVKITGGGGRGATAIAEWNEATGTITNLSITSPGSGYTSTPTVALVGGGFTTAATLGTPVLGAAGSGGLTKAGTGLLGVTNACTYAGNTTISAGTLALRGVGSIASSPNLTVASGATLNVASVSSTFTLGAGQTLGGSGTVAGAAIINGKITPGTSIGTLTMSVAPTLNASSVIVAEINRTNAPTADRLAISSGTLNYNGTLTVTNLGPALQAGDSFTLFTAPALGGSFTATNLPSLNAGLGWTFTNGVMTVVQTVATNPTNITSLVVGNALTLSWPADHIGWSLQAQTNTLATGLGTNWFVVPGSSATNWISVPLDANNGSVFFRLIYP